MKKIFALLVFATSALVSCEDNDGGLTGDYETFSVTISTPVAWQSSVWRYNASIPEWFTYSPKSGKAGNSTLTFNVLTKNADGSMILDYAEIEFNIADRFDTDAIAYITLNAEDYWLEFEGEVITEIDLSTWKGVEGVSLMVSVSDVPNLETVWLKQGQNIDIDDEGETWTIRYK